MSAVLRSMTSDKNRDLHDFPWNSWHITTLNFKMKISPATPSLQSTQRDRDFHVTCSCDLDSSPLRGWALATHLWTHPCESAHQPHDAVAWRWTSAYPPSPFRFKYRWEFKTQTRKRRNFQVEDWSGEVILKLKFDFNKAIALPGSGSHVQWSNTVDSTLRLPQPKRQTLSLQQNSDFRPYFHVAYSPSN